MKKLTGIFAALGVLSAAIALAEPPKSDTPAKPAKPIDVWTCPIVGEPIADHKNPEKGTVVGKYRVHFCCGGCPESFAKLSAKDKQTKAEAAYKKDQAAAKKTDPKKS